MKPLVIYHGGERTDGFGAAFAAWLKLGDNDMTTPGVTRNALLRPKTMGTPPAKRSTSTDSGGLPTPRSRNPMMNRGNRGK